jgi:hypothetical protein
MDIVTEPDLYTPSISEKGEYIDKIPSFANLKRGIKCPCGSRRDKIYETNATFGAHIKTKCHLNWISSLNLNKMNYYVESEKLKETVQNQRMIIARLENDNQKKIMTINYLSEQLSMRDSSSSNMVVVNDLIDF